ncbi:MAG TPA: LuxR C-terminal-related transcriptional regulator [Propionibacteriaceae bacterium]
MPNSMIATRLGLSPKTVANHLSSIFTKLQVADRAQAILRARDAGLGFARTLHSASRLAPTYVSASLVAKERPTRPGAYVSASLVENARRATDASLTRQIHPL